MDQNGIYLLLTIICGSLALLVLTEPVNVALNKETNAIFTCATFGREYYRNLGNKDQPQEIHKCDSDATHPPSAMVDGDTTTKWQSVSKFRIAFYGKRNLTMLTPPGLDNLHGVIYIDLKQVFNVETMRLMMGDAKRPSQMVVYKSTTSDASAGYRPWVYRVTTVSECQTKFSQPYGDTPTSSTGSTCTRYTNPMATGLETITFDFKHITDPALREWKKARYIKIELYDMPMPLGFEGDMFQHFAISEWVVMAECVCNGHQTGCELNSGTGAYECQCGGNTFGSFCELCKPMFNQQPFRYAEPCEPCSCHNHSTECSYDAAIAASNKSVNLQGQRSGGGVCSACQDHTAGVNCESCAATYFRPPGRDQTALDACVSCDCQSAGTVVSPLSGIKDDCVTNTDVVTDPPMLPGFCWCKANVEGNKCQRCKPGFYNLRSETALGCQACECNNAGTFGSSQACIPDQIGQCPCKVNTEGRACDTCKDGFYQLDVDNVDGCSACGCDPGGALAPVCLKDSGQCRCRPKVNGRQCDSPNQGFYYPGLDLISAQFEDVAQTWEKSDTVGHFFGNGYAVTQNGDRLDVVLSFPGGTTLSGSCTMVIRYKADEAVSLTVMILTSDNPLPAQVNLAPCPTTGSGWCYAQIDSRKFTLTPRPHSTVVQVTGAALLDQIVCIPVEFLDSESVLKSPAFAAKCDVIKNDMKVGHPYEPLCSQGVFSLTMYYLNGPRPCACHAFGSVSTLCDKHGGQCQCKAGVGGRQCDTCQPGFYNLSHLGCQACNCKGSNPFCDKIIGQCVCPPNTIGRQCDKCSPYFYGFDSITGCQACNCNEVGSSSLQCDLTTGMCVCKTGVTGQQCSSCTDGFTNFSPDGCTQCDCSPVGAVSSVCNKEDGQCPCKANVEGKQCSRCKPGSFYLDDHNPRGCLDCTCMGVVTQCSSALQSQQRISFLLATTTNGELSSVLSITDSDGTQVQSADLTSVSSMTLTARSAADGRIFLEAKLDGQSDVFWRMPPQLEGNLLGIYGSQIELDVAYSAGTPLSIRAILIGRDNVRLMYSLPPLDGVNAMKTLVISLTESHWTEQATSTTVSRGRFLLLISDTKMILVSARYSSSPHTTSLSRLEYSVVGASGVANPAVEQCQCGPQYKGLSCQECAPGYKRANLQTSSYLGMCVPCSCHQHASTCHPDTGVCIDCQDNTAGDSCEMCKPGFYGDATVGRAVDCIACPCYDPRVVNNTCVREDNIVKCSFCQPGYVGNLCDQCDTFYYGNPQVTGGTCTKCDCHGNSNSCNTLTGVCEVCEHNTMGLNCERCMVGFFGNASQQNCAACGCDDKGSTSPTCDHTTGECSCQPGVGNRICDQCQPNFYGFTNIGFPGCKPCGCNEQGSTSLQCVPDSGSCLCKTNVVAGAAKCDACSPGYFGLPDKPCEACNCNAVGVEGGAAAVCDVKTGHCPCKPGVTGRACDQCQPLHKDFGPQGCAACGQCETSLGKDAVRLADRWTVYYNTSQKVKAIQQQDTVLQGLQQQLTETQAKLGLFGSNTGSTSSIAANITQTQTEANTLVSDLEEKAVKLEAGAGRQKMASVSEVDRMAVFLTTAQHSLDLLRAENQKAFNYEVRLKEFNATASQYRNKRQVTGSLGLDFTAEQLRANDDLKVIQNDTRILTMEAQILQQTTAIGDLETKEQTLRTEFTAISEQIATADQTLDSLITQQSTVTVAVNAAKLSKDSSDALISQIQTAHDSAQGIITSTENTLQSVLQTKSDGDSVFRGNVLGVLPELAPLPAGITNLETGSSTLGDELVNTQAQLASAKSLVEQAEAKANSLQIQAGLINSTYQSVENHGDAAVKAIKNFEKVITTLQSSTTTSADAKKTIENAQTFLSGITVSALTDNAANSKQTSESLLVTLNNINYKPEVLHSLLTGGKSSLQMAKAKWTSVDQQLDQMNTAAQALNSRRTEKSIQQKIANAKDIATRAENLARGVKTSADAQLAALNTKQQEVDSKKGQAMQTNNLIAKVENDLQTFRKNVSTLRNNINLINVQKAEIFTRRSRLDNKMAAIEAKLAEARRLLGKIQQPVRFNGSMSVVAENSLVNSAYPYNDVRLDFRKEAGQTYGLFFFSENTASSAYLSLGLANNRVVFNYNNGGELITIENPADVCNGCWARAHASRYENTGYLTVTLLSTGGFASSWKKGTQASRILTLNSKLMFGQIPPGYQTSKYSGAGFLGCMQNTKFNGEEVNIWSSAVLSGQSTHCCKQMEIKTPELEPGTRFDGFGYLVLSGAGTDMSQNPVMFSVQFRTSNPSATILKIAKSDESVVYMIYLNRGQVTIDYRINDLSRVRISSGKSYSNGKWVQVTGIHKGQNHELKVEVLDETGVNTNEAKMWNSQYTADFTSLSGQDILLGASKHPNDVNYKADKTNFGGCMKNLKYQFGSGAVVQRALSQGVVSKKGVSFDGCFSMILKGISFRTMGSYVELKNDGSLFPITSIQFQLITLEPNGVILYFKDPVVPKRVLYLSVFHGNLILLYHESVLSSASTTSLYLSDGQLHDIKIDFTQNRASLKVDGTLFERSFMRTLASPSFPLSDNTPLYIGGIPDNSMLNSDYPARKSLVGAILILLINGRLLDLRNADAFVSHYEADLSGVMKPPSELPPPPYSTLMPLTTLSPPVCAAPPSPTYLQNFEGVWLRGNAVFIADISSKQALFYDNFATSLRFAAFSPDGLLLFVADSYTQPSQWLAIYLRDGKVHMQVKGTDFEDSLTSEFTYNDGIPHNLDFLVMYHYLVLVESSKKEYVSNSKDGLEQQPAFSRISTDLYLGGQDYRIQFNLPILSHLPGGFVGGIYSCFIKVNDFDSSRNFEVDWRNPKTSTAVGQLGLIPKNAYYGISLSGVNSYAKLSQLVSMENSNFILSLMFATTQPSANLFSIYMSHNHFLVVELANHWLRVVMANTQSFDVTVYDLTNLCDGKPHAVNIFVGQTDVKVKINSNFSRTYAYTPEFTPPTITNTVAYFGGFENVYNTFSQEIVKEHLRGCLIQIAINGVKYDTARMKITSPGATYACPY